MLLNRLSTLLSWLRIRVDDRVRRLEAGRRTLPLIESCDGARRLEVAVRSRGRGWARGDASEPPIPGMITGEERQYYRYIGRFYAGRGEVVELGPWLGRSTACLVEGLAGNPHFRDRRLQVYDDFVWRSDWMDRHVPAEQRLRDGDDFEPLFRKYTAPFADRIRAERRRIALHPDNAHVPVLAWSGAPIELIAVDCGRTMEVNEAWYRLFAPHFLPGRTLVVMQDWRLHRELPVKWYNQTRQFTDSKGAALQLVHEVRHGGIATFLYRG